MKKKTIIKILIPIVLILIYLFVPFVNEKISQGIFMLNSLDVDVIREYILSFGALAPIISFLLMVLQSLIAPLPAFLITFANAAIFGWFWGAVLSWSSAMVGAILCFKIANYYGRDLVVKLTGKGNLEKVDVFFDRHGKNTILICRLLPFMSFDIVSYAAGLTNISFKNFVIATGLGQLPATIIYSYVGSMLTGGVKYFVTALLIIFAMVPLIAIIKGAYNRKHEVA